MTKDEALDLALEALELNNLEWKSLADSGDAGFWSAEEQEHYKQTEAAITAIKQARSAPTVQEPVAWMDVDEKGAMYSLRFWSEPDNRHEVALYTMPRAQPAPVQDTEAHYKGVVEGVQKLFDDKRAQPALAQEPVAVVKVLPLGDGQKPMRWADWTDADNPPPEGTLLYTAAQRQWVEVEQVKWDGEKFIAKLKENT